MKKLLQHIRQSDFYGKTFVGAILILIIIKQILGFDGYALTNDMFLVMIVLILVSINSLTIYRSIKILLNIANALLLGIFTIDMIIIYAFQSRLSIFEMRQFLNNMHSPFFYMYMLYCLIGFFIFMSIIFLITQKIAGKIRFGKRTKIFCLILRIVGLGCLYLIPGTDREKTKAQLDIIRYNINFLQGKYEFLRDVQTNTGLQYQDFFTLQKGKGEKPNIILIYAESFSAVDSKRVEGLYDNMPLFDKIQEQGITYTNFLANGCTSETTHIATLQGVEPREHPSMTKKNAYSEYASLNPPLPKFLESNGYTTTFLSTVTLDFLNQKRFLQDMGFQTIYGDETFKGEKTYTFGAAPDAILYAKAIELSKKQSSPYFLAMQTISSHEPYSTPDGEGEAAALKYADKSIYDFYQGLVKEKFFDNGILIILADHRKIDIAGKKEKEKYGKTMPSRVLGTVVGKGIPKGVRYNLPIQHIDFYYSLKKLVGKKDILIRNKYNDAFTDIQNRDRTIRYCRYFLNDNGYVIMKGQKEGYGIESGETYIKAYINAYKRFQYDNRKSLFKTSENYLSGNFTEKLLKKTFKN